jgi:hypothetical protein
MAKGIPACEHCRGGECQARIVVSVAKSITEEHIGIDLIKSECWQIEDDELRMQDLFQGFPLVAVDVMLLPPEVEQEIPGFRWESVDEWESESHEDDYPGLGEWSQTLNTLGMERVVKVEITEDNL